MSNLRALTHERNLRPAWLPPELFPFESRFVDVDGARVHYVDEGRGPVLLFVHGAPNWSFFYRQFISALRDDFWVVFSGDSRDAVQRVIERLPLYPYMQFELTPLRSLQAR